MKVTKNEEIDQIYLTQEESSNLIIILDKVHLINGIDKEYVNFAKELKDKLWNI